MGRGNSDDEERRSGGGGPGGGRRDRNSRSGAGGRATPAQSAGGNQRLPAAQPDDGVPAAAFRPLGAGLGTRPLRRGSGPRSARARPARLSVQRQRPSGRRAGPQAGGAPAGPPPDGAGLRDGDRRGNRAGLRQPGAPGRDRHRRRFGHRAPGHCQPSGSGRSRRLDGARHRRARPFGRGRRHHRASGFDRSAGRPSDAGDRAGLETAGAGSGEPPPRRRPPPRQAGGGLPARLLHSLTPSRPSPSRIETPSRYRRRPKDSSAASSPAAPWPTKRSSPCAASISRWSPT
jgi:hypothetical protein